MGKKKNKNSHSDRALRHEGLKSETKQSIVAVIFFALAFVFTLAAFGKAGFAGLGLQRIFEFLFGKAFFLVPLVLFLAGFSLLFSVRKQFFFSTFMGAVLFLLSALGMITLIFRTDASLVPLGGYLGFLVSFPFLKLFDLLASLILLGAFTLIGFLIMLDIPLFFRRALKEEKEEGGVGQVMQESGGREFQQRENAESSPALPAIHPAGEGSGEERREPQSATVLPEAFTSFLPSFAKKTGKMPQGDLTPPLDILEDDRGTPSSGDIKANANIIRRTLQNFGIEVEMAEVNIGPSVAQYTLKPAQGVKLSKIVGLQNDLALALASHPIRIEAPIPGRSLVGIEIPNRAISLVGLKNLLSGEEFQKHASSLAFTLGRDVSGRPVYADLRRMPHLLIAGATGSGKSVAIHALLLSLLYRNPPERLRFMVVDPKRVELSHYSQIPHLLTPVITDAKRTILALRWAVREMERRYEILARYKVRDIHSYHIDAESRDPEAEAMPYLVIVVDELADIMAAYPRELEALIVRLSQMSRATGIHLVLSTQRPSVEVITGLIKANMSSRIAFQVASQVDSRTILDVSGAEKLLGNGDMLFMAGDISKPRRVQGAFVSEREVKQVTKWLFEHSGGVEDERGKEGEIFPSVAQGSGEEVLSEVFESGDENGDALYDEALRLALEAGKVSASYLQRRLRVGYARAARLLDLMEERGVIGPQDGARPREVLTKEREYENTSLGADKGEGARAGEPREKGENSYDSFA